MLGSIGRLATIPPRCSPLLGHEPLARDDIQRLDDILADLGELGAAQHGQELGAG